MLTIGQFSGICHVTVKALRHYDRIGLLPPALIDPDTGYRYYSEDQLPDMLLIARLKRYGFTLVEIAAILSCQDHGVLRSKFLVQRARLEQQRDRTALILAELDRHITEFERTDQLMSHLNDYRIQLEHTQPLPILSLRQRMSVEEYGYHFSTLYEQLARQRLTPAGGPMSIYHDDEFRREDNDTELAVPILEADKATRLLPGGLCASTVHRGAYSSLGDGYGALTRWCVQEGYELAGAPYEVYLKSGRDSLPVEEWETQLYFPVRQR